jgi:hypothetical protein
LTRLTWGDVGERFYETGVDRGVLYVDDAGVSWNGLVSVTESPSGGEAQPYYIDGVKYLNISSLEEFEGTVEAFTYPDEFSPCDGSEPGLNGLFITQQRRKPFGLSYRTKIGNDVEGINLGYKIHLIYGATTSPTQRTNTTIDSNVTPNTFSWPITTKAPLLNGRKPSAHFFIDSRKTPIDLLTDFENIIYGNPSEAPRLPTAQELVEIFNLFNILDIDAGAPSEPFDYTYDGGTLFTTQTDTLDGGTP